jgi:peptide/nickel transport system permease protein
MSEVSVHEAIAVEEGLLEADLSQEPAEDGGRREFRPGVSFWLAVGWIALFVLIAVFADLLPLQDPYDPDPRNTAAPPSADHWFGTDSIGRDLFSRAAFGARVSLIVAFISASAAAILGSLLGFVAGYFRGRTEGVVMGAMDILLAYPALVFALALTAFLGPSATNVIIAITFIAVPIFARLVRAQTLTYAEREFVLASRAAGATDRRTLMTEIAPNVAPSILAFALVLAALAILIEGALSFVGAGVPLPTPTWGSIISSGQQDLETAPHISLITSGIIFLTVLALNTAGDRLRAHFDAQERPQ